MEKIVFNRANVATGFRQAAKAVRQSPTASVATTANVLAVTLARQAVEAGYLDWDKIDEQTQLGKAEAQSNLDAYEAGNVAGLEGPFEPLARHFDRIADLIEPQANADTAQPNTRAKVVARLREIGVALLPLVEDNEAAHIFIAEATMLEHGAVAAGWVDQDAVDRQFALGYASVAGAEMADRNQGYIKDLNWLADQIENVGATAQGDGATAPFTDISTVASKRMAIAKELRTVRDKIKTFGDNIYDERGIAVIESTLNPLVDKAVELAFVTDDEIDRIYAEAQSMSESVDSYLAAVSTIANRIEQGAAQQEKVA